MMRNEKKSVKLIASVFLGVGYMFLLALMIATWVFVFVVFLQGGNKATSKEEITWVFILISIITAFTFLTVILLLHRAFAVITISEYGIKKSLFRIFHKREILWEEVAEMRIFWQVGGWLFVGKSSLKNLNYNQLIKRKDAIQITLSQKALKAIRMYYDKPITGLTEENEQKILASK